MTGILRPILAAIVFSGLLTGARAETPAAAAASASSSSANGPRTLDAALKQADQLISIEKLAKALAVLKTIDAKTPQDAARVDTGLGNIYLRLHRPAKAADLFERAIFSTMDDARAYLGLARARLALGDLIKARSHARTALLTNPDLIGADLVLAKADDRSGRVSAARKRFANLIKNQPESEPVIVAYAMFMADRDSVNSAVKLLSAFVDRHPFAAEASDLLGQLYWRQGRKTDALLLRGNAAKAFKAKGNDFRAEAIRSWLSFNGPGFLRRPPPPPQKKQEKARPVPPPPPPQAGKVEARRTQPRFSPIRRPDPLPFPAGTELSTGSGFVVEGGRYVITNNHVIKNTGKIAVRSGTGEVRLARVVRVTVKDDLAILKLARAFPEDYAIPFGDMADAGPGRSAVVMGFPMASVFGWRQPSLTEGIVSKASGLNDNPGTFLITSKMNKGNSGGPIFDRHGRLIGVAVAKLDTIKIYERKGSLPEDMNIAIKASRVLNFLNRKENEGGRPPAPEMKLEDLYRAMLAKVVMVAAAMRQ